MKKILLAIMAFAVLPAFASANELNTGISLGNSKMGGDNYTSDSKLAYSIFSEINLTPMPNLFIGAEVQKLGTMKYEDEDGKDEWAVYQYGTYAKLKLFDIPNGSGSFFGNFKLGFGGYVTRVEKNGDGHAIDADGFGYNIGFGVGYMFNQGTSVSLSYTMHNYEEEDTEGKKADDCKVKVFGITVAQKFGYTPKRSVRKMEKIENVQNVVYEQQPGQRPATGNMVVSTDPCGGLCPKTVPAAVLNLNYNNQW